MIRIKKEINLKEYTKLHDPQVCTFNHRVSPSVRLSVSTELVKMLIILGPHGIL